VRGDTVAGGQATAAAPAAAERQQRSELAAQERAAADERERLAAREREGVAASERERHAVEQRERLIAVERERVAAAERALAEREARVLAQERALAVERERLALERQQEELAARDAELRERERLLAQQSQLEPPLEPAVDDTDDTDDYEEDTAAAASTSSPAPVHERAVLVDRDFPAPAPRQVEASLRAGSVVEVEIQEPLTSRTAQVGDAFSTRVARDIRNEDGQVVIPVDSTIVGRVTEVTPLRKVGGQAALGLELTELVLPDDSRVAIRASFVELGKDKKGDKKKIAIAAAAGAVLGAILGHDAGGAAAGAAVGAAAGTAVVMTAKDQDVELAAGDLVAVRLEEVVTVKTGMAGLAP
jgi:hypothetical protein